ncbi:hypothetical protein [uncultured Aliiroseovarius sp.]|uniref:hypothetical protein n=1 Tax=uncultured Aliiroseovarius sp. TaxID=1658783 RepID=UPI0026395FAD|nr:hypothetical protein [uncultured Aliiroseovarius sp.]
MIGLKHLKHGVAVVVLSCAVLLVAGQQARADGEVGVTIVADVSADARGFTAQAAQRFARTLRRNLGDHWAKIDLQAVAFANGMDPKVERLSRVSADDVKDKLLSFRNDASHPEDPLLRAMAVAVRGLDVKAPANVIVVLSGGDVRDTGPGGARIDAPGLTFPDNTHVILIKVTPEVGRDLRTLSGALKRSATTVNVFGFDVDAPAKAANELVEALQVVMFTRGIIGGGDAPIVVVPGRKKK